MKVTIKTDALGVLWERESETQQVVLSVEDHALLTLLERNHKNITIQVS